MVVCDHCLVKCFFGMIPIVYLLSMIYECFSCTLYRLWRYFSKMYRLCWQRFPCRRVPPVNIWTIAALIRTTIATPNQERAGSNVEAVRVNDPIICVFHGESSYQFVRLQRALSRWI